VEAEINNSVTHVITGDSLVLKISAMRNNIWVTVGCLQRYVLRWVRSRTVLAASGAATIAGPASMNTSRHPGRPTLLRPRTGALRGLRHLGGYYFALFFGLLEVTLRGLDVLAFGLPFAAGGGGGGAAVTGGFGAVFW
jgi:hypothetical protein